MKLAKNAHRFAKEAHKGQKQTTGKPYIKHAESVAKLLKKWGQKEETIAAGYLHDVVEDSNIRLTKLKREFGEEVSILVDGASWIKKKKNGKWTKDWQATYKKFSKIAKKYPELILIKLADFLSNIPNINEKSNREFIVSKSYPRYMTFWYPLFIETGFKDEANKIKKEYNKYVNTRMDITLYKYLPKNELKIIKSKLK